MSEVEIKAAATDDGVRAWKKAVYQKANQTNANATDIGWLRNNDSRLNVVSKMTQFDKQQVFKIKALSDGNLAFGSQSDQDVRIQVYDAHNRVVGDSKPNMGKASENYEAMKTSSYAMKAGTYYVKITRAAGVPDTTDVHYALQMRQGDTYKNDYVTTQVEMTQAQRAQAAVNPMANMPAGLTTYTSAATLLGDAMMQRSGLLGGVDFSNAGNVFGVVDKYA